MADSINYAFYVLFHPFDGFWDLKHEKKGTIRAAAVSYTHLDYYDWAGVTRS